MTQFIKFDYQSSVVIQAPWVPENAPAFMAVQTEGETITVIIRDCRIIYGSGGGELSSNIKECLFCAGLGAIPKRITWYWQVIGIVWVSISQTIKKIRNFKFKDLSPVSNIHIKRTRPRWRWPANYISLEDKDGKDENG